MRQCVLHVALVFNGGLHVYSTAASVASMWCARMDAPRFQGGGGGGGCQCEYKVWQQKGDLDMVATKKTERCGVDVGQHVQHTVSAGTSNGCESFFLSVSGGAIGTVSTREYSLPIRVAPGV